MATGFPSLMLPLFFLVLFHTNDANRMEQLSRQINISVTASRSIRNNPQRKSVAPFSPAGRITLEDGLMKYDKIKSLPGQPDDIDFDQYAGYVTVDPKAGRALFYYFVESPRDSNKKPLVLWLNGGPGCSSLGIGAMMELGPFRVNSDGKTLRRNLHAWNKVANVLFLESPAGVGFSYSNKTMHNGDKITSDENYIFLIKWLERFPHYKTREFFITGESYAGHYVPELATTIIRNNKVTNQTVINLKGIAIGNADIDRVAKKAGGFELLWAHSIISDKTYLNLKNCNWSRGSTSPECQAAVAKAKEEAGDINPYNVYAPTCHDPNVSTTSVVAMAKVDPCAQHYVNSYLNTRAVQDALHVNVTKLGHPWERCRVDPKWKDRNDTVLPMVKQLIISSGIRVWLYSGNLDFMVPVTATKLAIKKLGLSITHSWKPWYSGNEVGGYRVGYGRLTFVTIRGAGHMVPLDQPERALTMITSFLQAKLIKQ